MLLIGVGFALGFPSLNIQATTGVDDHEQGLASGLVNTSFQVGGAIALAIVERGRQRRTAAAAPGRCCSTLHPAIGVVTGVAALGLVGALTAHGCSPAPRPSSRSCSRQSPGPRSRSSERPPSRDCHHAAGGGRGRNRDLRERAAGARARRLAHGEWGLTLPAEQPAGWPLDVGLRPGGRPAQRKGPGADRADELDPWMLLWWNRQTRVARFACTRSREVWVHADVPAGAAGRARLDRLLGLWSCRARVTRARGVRPRAAPPNAR